MPGVKGNAATARRRERGAALIVGLVLLVVITVFAMAAMTSAATALALARSAQNHENAFQAAEAGLELALGQQAFSLTQETVLSQRINSRDHVTVRITHTDWSPVPDAPFNAGAGSDTVAYHFVATAEAESIRDPRAASGRDARAIQSQAFYVLGPASARDCRGPGCRLDSAACRECPELGFESTPRRTVWSRSGIE